MKYLFLFAFLLFEFHSFAQQTVEDDFEGNGTITNWFGDDCGLDIGFANPFQVGINTSATVLKYTDTGGSYANVRFQNNAKFDLSINNTFSLKIYVPSSSITGSETNKISLKLQNGDLSEPWTTQTEIEKNINLDQWQIVTFDFENDTYRNYNSSSGNPTVRTDLNRVVLQINGENNSSQVTAYIDDFEYDGTIEETVNTDPVFDNLIWSDEFDGSGAINSTNWFHQTIIPNGNSWFNGEVQHYTNRTENSFVSDGTLKINAKRESFTDQGVTKQFTSARLNSKFAFTYGKVEIKAKMPFGVGTWPALWMLGQNIIENGGYWAATNGTVNWPACGEIDIVEHWGNNQDFVQSALHTPSSYGGTVNKGGRTITGASTQFHIYTLEWTAEKMVFKVDGITHYIYNPSVKNASTWPFDAPQYLLFNVAIQPDIAAGFTESAMEIDYVRIYQESTASVSNNNFEDQIKVYPNPTLDAFTIKIPTKLVASKATLFSITGKKVKDYILKNEEDIIDVSELAKGIYFLRITNNNRSYSLKLIKK